LDTIIITASEKGCFNYNSAKVQYVPGIPVKVKDAVGAGDAFSTSFMHVYTEEGDALNAAKIANRVGAYVATKAGAIPEYSGEIKKSLKGGTRKLSDAPQNIL
jgi:fructokinase